MTDTHEPLPDFSAIRAAIATLPRVKLIARPTPITEAPNLARTLSGGQPGPRIFIKRDDLTGVAFGGNKLRNLEFRLARTSEHPDTVDRRPRPAVQFRPPDRGRLQQDGLGTILVLEGEKPDIVQGNLLVDYLLGAEVISHRRGGAARRTRRTRGAGARSRAAGRIS